MLKLCSFQSAALFCNQSGMFLKGKIQIQVDLITSSEPSAQSMTWSQKVQKTDKRTVDCSAGNESLPMTGGHKKYHQQYRAHLVVEQTEETHLVTSLLHPNTVPTCAAEFTIGAHRKLQSRNLAVKIFFCCKKSFSSKMVTCDLHLGASFTIVQL